MLMIKSIHADARTTDSRKILLKSAVPAKKATMIRATELKILSSTTLCGLSRLVSGMVPNEKNLNNFS
jgi:hypothetical protein